MPAQYFHWQPIKASGNVQTLGQERQSVLPPDPGSLPPRFVTGSHRLYLRRQLGQRGFSFPSPSCLTWIIKRGCFVLFFHWNAEKYLGKKSQVFLQSSPELPVPHFHPISISTGIYPLGITIANPVKYLCNLMKFWQMRAAICLLNTFIWLSHIPMLLWLRWDTQGGYFHYNNQTVWMVLCYVCNTGSDLKRTLTRKEARICFKVWQIWKTRFNSSRIINTFQACYIFKGYCQVDLGTKFRFAKSKEEKKNVGFYQVKLLLLSNI